MSESAAACKILQVTPDICLGCHICEIVCSLSKTGIVNPSLSRIQVINSTDDDVISPVFVPIVCRHCKKPPCKAACPVPEAMEISERTGVVVINESECIGCLACVSACPFGAIFVDPSGQPLKCDLCGGDPMCVKYCPATPANSSPYLPYPRASCLEYIEPHTAMENVRLAQIARSKQSRKVET